MHMTLSLWKAGSSCGQHATNNLYTSQQHKHTACGHSSYIRIMNFSMNLVVSVMAVLAGSASSFVFSPAASSTCLASRTSSAPSRTVRGDFNASHHHQQQYIYDTSGTHLHCDITTSTPPTQNFLNRVHTAALFGQTTRRQERCCVWHHALTHVPL